MERRRLRRCWLIPLGLLPAPLVLWLAIVTAAPTNWARARLVRAIETTSGRSVRLGGLNVCLLGGMRLTDLEIGAPGAVGDPWFRAGEVTLDLSPLSVFQGRMTPRKVDVRNAVLRIMRRRDGSLELSDLVRPANRAAGRSTEESDCCALGSCPPAAHQVRLNIHDARIIVVDQRNETRDEIENVEGEATLEGKSGGVFALGGALQGGTVQLTGRFDRTMREPRLDVQVAAADVDLDRNDRGLRYLIPLLAGADRRLAGKLAAQATFQARGSDVATLSESLVGQGSVTLDPVRLEGSSFLDALRKTAELPTAELSNSIQTRFEIENRKITAHSFPIQIGSVPFRFTGWTDFDGALEYTVYIDGLANRIPQQALQFLQEADLDLERMSTLQLSGDVDHLLVHLDGEPVDLASSPGDRGGRRDERERLRSLGRKVLDRLVR